MTRLITGILAVIAAGILMVAYSLFTLHAPPDAMTLGSTARPYFAGQQFVAPDGQVYMAQPVANGMVPAAGSPAAIGYLPYSTPQVQDAGVRAVRTSTITQAPARRTTRVIERSPRRDWKKTAMMIGGSTAAGAGLGGIFGGKKGALIGAAIAGGASTLYESQK